MIDTDKNADVSVKKETQEEMISKLSKKIKARSTPSTRL